MFFDGYRVYTSMQYNFILTVNEEESGDRIVHIEAHSLESLEEQLHKAEKAVEAYEENNLF